MRVLLHTTSAVAHGIPCGMYCKPLVFLTLGGQLWVTQLAI
jgi:hypothetical protein